MDVRIDEAGPRRAAQPHDLGPATRRRPRAGADRENAAVRTRGDRWPAAGEQHGPLFHRP
jgi:hypothetical protein